MLIEGQQNIADIKAHIQEFCWWYRKLVNIMQFTWNY